MYQCNESLQCISARRLSDGVEDCYGGDDEKTNRTCSLKDKIHIQCPSGEKCVSHMIAYDVASECLFEEGNEYFVETPSSIPFPIICDGFIEVNLHKMIDYVYGNSNLSSIETDETHCEEWSCNNIYTRCDGFWNCRDGSDELHCPLLNRCSPKGFECLSPETFNITCLPASKFGDNHMDCIGGTDERFFCRNMKSALFSPRDLQKESGRNHSQDTTNCQTDIPLEI
ncbi:unnamed protein product [Rotaria sp. Silwood1]|nr:unnamed protein product [Rotaria sp. Silwood1]CAF1646964.1 unnamed protein product [Rotaria sp. Silwood1]